MSDESSHVALLRGINVGGKHRLPMQELREIFEESGCTDVRTYIQSGNVVFRCEHGMKDQIPTRIEAAIRERCGFEAPVVLRSAAEMEQIVANNPFVDAASDEKALHVMFLSERPSEVAVSSLDPHRSTPDRFELVGGEIFLYCPKGVARTKLTTQYFDSTLGTVSTARNWRTVRTLVEMSR